MLLHELCKFSVAVSICNLLQLIHGYARLEGTLSLRQALELFKRSEIGVITLLHFAA